MQSQLLSQGKAGCMREKKTMPRKYYAKLLKPISNKEISTSLAASF